jgi:hypothetical protein
MGPTIGRLTVTITSLMDYIVLLWCFGGSVVDDGDHVGGGEEAMYEGAHVHVVAGTDELITERLRLRPWTGDDADAALRIFGRGEVARWLTPEIPHVTILNDMRRMLGPVDYRTRRIPEVTGSLGD